MCVSEAKVPSLVLLLVFPLLRYRYCFLSSHRLTLTWLGRLTENSPSPVWLYSLIIAFFNPSFFSTLNLHVCQSQKNDWNQLVSVFVLLLLLTQVAPPSVHPFHHPAFTPVLIIVLKNCPEFVSLYLQSHLLSCWLLKIFFKQCVGQTSPSLLFPSQCCLCHVVRTTWVKRELYRSYRKPLKKPIHGFRLPQQVV